MPVSCSQRGLFYPFRSTGLGVSQCYSRSPGVIYWLFVVGYTLAMAHAVDYCWPLHQYAHVVPNNHTPTHAPRPMDRSTRAMHEAKVSNPTCWCLSQPRNSARGAESNSCFRFHVTKHCLQYAHRLRARDCYESLSRIYGLKSCHCLCAPARRPKFCTLVWLLVRTKPWGLSPKPSFMFFLRLSL